MLRRKEEDGSTVLEGGSLSKAQIVDMLYPVGAIYISTLSTNPGSGITPQFPGTTWVAWGAGRAVVGAGSNGVNSYSGEQTFGVDSITLTSSQCGVNAHTHSDSLNAPGHTHSIPSHQHGVDYEYLIGENPAGTGYDFVVNIQGGSNTVGAYDKDGLTEFDLGSTTGGASSTALSGSVGSVSGGSSATSHENRQASIATYLWKRTA